MDFFAGFSWPVPTAFASAVAACRFEQGDVLYNSRYAYEAWEPAPCESLLHLQVLEPPRSARAAAQEGDGTRFSANWGSPVSFELRNYQAAAVESRRSTQGRLFSCLWKGDASLLAESGGEPPSPPLLGRDLHRALQASRDAVLAASGRVLLQVAAPQLLYVSVLDRSSDASRAKASLVEAQLRTRFGVATAALTPGEASLPEAKRYHPALVLRCIGLDTSDEEVVHEALKGALYARSKASEAAPAGRFMLQRHGLLGSPRRAADAAKPAEGG